MFCGGHFTGQFCAGQFVSFERKQSGRGSVVIVKWFIRMASSRKKLDEKNLKTLRELASLPQNKYCFDCNQRGPTYVNVTIGSFVCTKCSGML